jgi:hypothetical protein
LGTREELMIRPLSFYYCVIITAFSLVCTYAGESVPLVGSLNSTRDEVISATDVVLGKFTKVRAGGFESMMGVGYHGEITILQVLKGNAFGSLEVGFSVIRGPKNTEAEPNLDDKYIIMMSGHDVRKLLPATDANIAKIKALIAAAPAAK